MARIRTIKPEFWTSEQITECSMSARLLFIGLWNFCDDEGRIVDSSRQLKMKIFPGDDLSIEIIHGLLTELSVNGLIIRYDVDNKQYLQVTGWHHQKINRSNPSKIPPYPSNIHGAFTERSPEKMPEGKGREGKGKDINPPTPLADDGEPPSLGKKKKQETENGLFKNFERWYTQHCQNLTQFTPNSWTSLRFQAVREAWQTNPDADWWESYFEACGKRKGLWKNNNDWVADMFWLIKPDNIAKISEGKFRG